MFLPVLLVRDFGPWAWAVFAIPNVIGAAAMGRVLRDAEASREITDAHTEACTAFSAVTILFQVTFVGWIGRLLVGNWAAVLMLGTVALTLAISQRGRRAEWAMAAGLFVFSVVAFAVALSSGREMILAGFPTRWDEESTALPYLAMVCMLGFGLCPYLDLTFHKARQATSPAAGLGAFIFGFGGPFLLMLVFTLWYARLLAPLSRGACPRSRTGSGGHWRLICACNAVTRLPSTGVSWAGGRDYRNRSRRTRERWRRPWSASSRRSRSTASASCRRASA